MSIKKLDLFVLTAACSLAFACGDSAGGGEQDAGPDGAIGAGGAGGSNDAGPGLTCGTGTTEQGGKCVGVPGMRLTCAEGTFEHNGECVAVDPNDKTAPTTTVEPMGGRYLVMPAKVTLTTDEPARIYYTTDGSKPDTSSDFQPSPAVVAPVTDGMVLRFFAEDPAGNAEGLRKETYEQVATPPPPVTDVAVSMNGNDATLTWKTPSEADGVVIVQLGDGAVVSPTPGESYKEGDALGSGTVVFVGSAEEFTAADLPVGVTSFLIYTYNDVLLYSGGVLARSDEIALPPQTGALTVNVATTTATVGTQPKNLKVTAGNVVYDSGNGRVSVDVTVKNNAARSIFLPKLLIEGAALAAGGNSGLFNSEGNYPISSGVATGTVDVRTLTLPTDVASATLTLTAGNGNQNLNFADPAFTGTTPASLVKYINDNSTGLVASLDATKHVVITNMPPGSGKSVTVNNSGVGATLGFDGAAKAGTDLKFVYFCPKDPDADDDSIIDDNTLCMRALQPGDSVKRTLTFDTIVADSIVTVDFELTGNRLAVGGDAYNEGFSTSQAFNSYIPLFDTRANQGVGFFLIDPLALGPQGASRTSSWVLAPNGINVWVGAKVGLRVTTYDLRTARVVGGADLGTGLGHVADMALASDGFLYALLNVGQHEYRWSSNHEVNSSAAVVLRLDPNTFEELARAQVALQRPEYTAPATYTTSVDLSGLTLPTDVASGTLVVSVNGGSAQTVDFASPVFTGTTAAALATFIEAHSTGLSVSVDANNHLVIETEANGKDETFQFTTTAAATTLGIDTALHEGDETATYLQNSSSYAPRVKRMNITDDASMLAFGVVQTAQSINRKDLDTGEVYLVDLATMTFVDQDASKDGIQPVYLSGAIDPNDTGLDEIAVGPTTVAFSPDGKTLFAAGDDQVTTDVDAVAVIDVAGGDVTFKAIPSNDNGKSLWRRSDGVLWLMTWNQLYEVDPSDGGMTLISDSVNDYNAFTPGVDGNYFAKDYYDGMAEMAPDGTELYFALPMCASSVPGTGCSRTVYNYGRAMVTTPY